MSFMDEVEEAERGQLNTGDELAKSKLNALLCELDDMAVRAEKEGEIRGCEGDGPTAIALMGRAVGIRQAIFKISKLTA